MVTWEFISEPNFSCEVPFQNLKGERAGWSHSAKCLNLLWLPAILESIQINRVTLARKKCKGRFIPVALAANPSWWASPHSHPCKAVILLLRLFHCCPHKPMPSAKARGPPSGLWSIKKCAVRTKKQEVSKEVIQKQKEGKEAWWRIAEAICSCLCSKHTETQHHHTLCKWESVCHFSLGKRKTLVVLFTVLLIFAHVFHGIQHLGKDRYFFVFPTWKQELEGIQRTPFTHRITVSALTCNTSVKSGTHKGAQKNLLKSWCFSVRVWTGTG